jgi:hypothetical protein
VILISNNKTYDKLKFLAQIVLPALGTLYFALAGIWGLHHAEQVVGTIVAVDTFIGVVLQLSSTAYDKSDQKFDGAIDVLEAEDGVQNFINSDEIRLKVNSPAPKKVVKRRMPRKNPPAEG